MDSQDPRPRPEDEDIIGYICCLTIGGKEFGTRAIVITSSRLISIRRVPFWGPYGGWEYLGPGSTLPDSKRAKFVGLAKELLPRRDKEISSAEILRVTFTKPDYRNGKVVVKTDSTEVAIPIIGIMGGRISAVPSQIRALIESLLYLVPDRLYNEATGNLIADDLKNGIDYL